MLYIALLFIQNILPFLFGSNPPPPPRPLHQLILLIYKNFDKRKKLTANSHQESVLKVCHRECKFVHSGLAQG